MPFDGLSTSQVIKELNHELTGQRIEKVYQPEGDELVLVVRRKKGSVRLLVSAHSRWARMHMTRDRKENPPRPSSFCMLLRKHLEGGRILKFKQIGCDRIVHIHIEALNELLEWQEKVLACEFTGKNSNLVLIDPYTNLIIDGIKKYGHELSSYREVQPGVSYILPPSQNKLNPTEVDYSTFCQALWENHSQLAVSYAIFLTLSGFSPHTCKELCLISGINPDMPAGECGDYELSRIYKKFRGFMEETLPLCPTVIMNNQGVMDFFPFTPYAEGSTVFKTFPTLNEAMDYFYSSQMAQVRLESVRTNLLRQLKTHLDKAYKKLYFQEGDLVQAKKGEVYRQWGELLTAYAFQVKKGETRVSLPNFDGQGYTEIELLPYLSPVENAQRYFKRYTKSRKSSKHLEYLMASNRQDIEYLESVAQSAIKAETLEEIKEITDELEEEGYIKHKKMRKKTALKSKPRCFRSSDGIAIIVGKNNRQNDQLTLKQANKEALWFHVQGFAGTHVILDIPSEMKDINQVPDSSIEEAALLAAYYSKGRESEKIPVDYTFCSNVRKPRGARPGMVVYDNYWTIYVNPLDLRVSTLLQTCE